MRRLSTTKCTYLPTYLRGPHSMKERDVRGVYSHPPATGGIRLGGVVAGDVGDAIRIDDLRGIKIPYYDGNPSNLDDFILDWEDFAEEVVGEMQGAPRDKWVCRTFPHRLAQDLKEELRDQIREGLIRTEQACFQWLEDEERVDAPNQKLEVKPVRTPVAILGSLGVCIYAPASRHWLISYSPVHLN